MKKLKTSLISFFGLMKKKFTDRQFWDVILLILSALALVGFALLVIYFASTVILSLWNTFLAIWDFIAENIVILAMIAGATVVGVYYAKENGRIKRQEQRQQLLQQEQLANAEQQRLAEQNYILIRQIIFNVLQDIGRLVNIEPPQHLSSLDAPVHASFQNGTLFFYCAALKQGVVDCPKVRALVQDRLQQMALAHELGLQPTAIVYRGISYPVILLDRVTDMGSYIEFRIAWASETYLSQRGNRGNFGGGSPSGRNDDGEF